MRRIRRNDWAPRVEMTAMIDVIFLLLTFFIYCMIMMIRADVLPVRLTPISTGNAATPEKIEAITIDKSGSLFFNRQKVAYDELDARLSALAKDGSHGRIYVALEAEGASDRGPVLLNMIERLRAAGINDFVFVGAPAATKSDMK